MADGGGLKMTTLSETISKLFDMFPHRTAEEVLEDAMSTIDKLQTFTTGVLVGQGNTKIPLKL